MNLFRSEEHVRNWPGYKEETENAILSLRELMDIFETPRHKEKFDGKYISLAPEYAPQFFEKLRKVTNNAAFWNPAT